MTLVNSTVYPVNTEWRIARFIQKKIRHGWLVFTTKACVLRQRGIEIEALPFPIGSGEHFVKWSFNRERRKEADVAEGLSSIENELQRVGDKIEVAMRLKNKPKVMKSLQEL